MFGINTIARKLPLALVVSAAIVSLGVGTGSYLVGSQMVGDLTTRNLSSLAYERSKEVKEFVATLTGDVQTTGGSESTNQAIRDFGNAWLQLQGDRAGALRQAFVTDNPNPSDQKMLLDSGPTNLNYSVTHAQFNPAFRKQLLTHHYADIYLIGPDGNIYYSVTKGSDYAGNVKDPASPLTASGLGQVFAAATAEAPTDSQVVFADFAPYGPDKRISAFAGLPMFNNASGRMMGIVAFRFDPALLEAVVNDRTGLGETGEVLVVGSDHLLRVDSSFDEANNVLATTLDGAAVDSALSGTLANGTISDYRNARMLIAAAPVQNPAVNWAVAAVMTESEAFAPIGVLRNTMLLIGLGLLLVAAIISLLFARSVTRPISSLTGTMQALAGGDLGVEVKGSGRSDEIGEMARTVEVFRE
ncbi:MAG: cache and HAMP domain-containing protein, partial [Devosia sp.]